MTTEIKPDVNIEQLIHPNLRQRSMEKIPQFAELAEQLTNLSKENQDLLNPDSGFLSHNCLPHCTICLYL